MASPAAPAPPLAVSSSAPGAALGDYRQLLAIQLVKAVAAAEGLGEQLEAATSILSEGFTREAGVIEAMGICTVRFSLPRFSEAR